MDLKQYVTIVPDFPKPGIQFKDITTIMDKGEVYKYATDQIVNYAREKKIDVVVELRSAWFYYRLSSCLCARRWICPCP